MTALSRITSPEIPACKCKIVTEKLPHINVCLISGCFDKYYTYIYNSQVYYFCISKYLIILMFFTGFFLKFIPNNSIHIYNLCYVLLHVYGFCSRNKIIRISMNNACLICSQHGRWHLRHWPSWYVAYVSCSRAYVRVVTVCACMHSWACVCQNEFMVYIFV